MKKLAIKGHSTRGEEVMELLKMMGGRSDCGVSGSITHHYYYLNTPTYIDAFAHESDFFIRNKNNFVFYTLEEFLEKYPLKIGDLKDLACDHRSCVITEMRWNEQAECVEYHTEFGPNDYGWHRVYDFCSDYQIEEPDTVISGIYLNSCDYADEVELNLGDYKIEVREGKTYAIRNKSTYPTTYEECVEIMGVELWNTLWGEDATKYEKQTEDLVNAFIKLKVCRDAYWKIAGEQMGLNKPWEPNWTTFEGMPAIFTFRYNIVCDSVKNQHCLLVFPTEEMRNAFCKNFKDLIKQCKELL